MANLNTNMQHRCAFQPSGLAMREEDGNTLEGVAIVTGVETILWEGTDWREVEIIDQSCITQEFIDSQDIKLNLLHERSLSFARNGEKGTLTLQTREDGLHFSTPIPDCAIGQQARALVENGTYTGCSFEFYPRDYEVSERMAADGKTEYVIRHKAFDRIGAITIGMDPAYPTTSCGLRELYREQNKDKFEDPKEDPAIKAAAEQREKETRNAFVAALRAEMAAEDALDARQ